jgi:hypothetical protein
VSLAKGFFTHGAAVLFSSQASLDEIEPLLRSVRVVKRDNKGVDPDLSGPSLLVAVRPQVNGYVTVDVQNRRWPDHMGDPKNETGLFGAWSMATLGPSHFRAACNAPGSSLGAGTLEKRSQQRIVHSFACGSATCSELTITRS